MKMLTLRLKPKTIFGLLLVFTGIVVIVITFASNHIKSNESVMNSVTLETNEERESYLTSLGWEFKTDCTEKQVKIPEEFNDVYSRYNEIQNLSDLSIFTLNEIKQYYVNYGKLHNCDINIVRYHAKEEALELIKEHTVFYKKEENSSC